MPKTPAHSPYQPQRNPITHEPWMQPQRVAVQRHEHLPPIRPTQHPAPPPPRPPVPPRADIPLQRPLGHGAFGDVFVGGEDVAVKLVRRGFGPQAKEKIKALRREDAALKKCEEAQVPHVIGRIAFAQSVYGRVIGGKLVGLDFDQPKYEGKYDALVIDLAHEGALDKLLAKGALPENRCRTIAKDLLEALAGLHQKAVHITHRDIKPANIVFEKGEIQLIDFGISSDQERPTTPAGTPYYMAPEVWEAGPRHPYDNRADLWSVGVVIYEALTGRRPFNGFSERDILATIRLFLKGYRPLPFPPHVSEAARHFVLSLLKSAHHRASAEAMLAHQWFESR